MIRAPLAAAAALLCSLVAPASPAAAQDQTVAAAEYEFERFTPQQLDNLVSPIALYPDALLAQVLIAATFPDQVEEAAIWVRANGTDGIDDMAWDVSVKSVAHYPSALNMMADKADWMATLGQAYAYQSTDVMSAVQRMRAMADAQGNLVSTPQQEVLREADSYVIVPANPRVIYVPVYDPLVVYTRPLFSVGLHSRYWSFGIGFPIGGWLNYDLDWGRRVVYYNGWNHEYLAWGGGWRARSRPFIHITNVYVGPLYKTVHVGRSPWHRRIDYDRVDRHGRIHRDVYIASGRRGRNGPDSRDGRTARPRDGGAVATPGGYSRPGSDRADARNGNDGRNDRVNPAGRGNPGGNDNARRAPVTRPGADDNARRSPTTRPKGGGDDATTRPTPGTRPGGSDARAGQRRGSDDDVRTSRPRTNPSSLGTSTPLPGARPLPTAKPLPGPKPIGKSAPVSGSRAQPGSRAQQPQRTGVQRGGSGNTQARPAVQRPTVQPRAQVPQRVKSPTRPQATSRVQSPPRAQAPQRRSAPPQARQAPTRTREATARSAPTRSSKGSQPPRTAGTRRGGN